MCSPTIYHDRQKQRPCRAHCWSTRGGSAFARIFAADEQEAGSHPTATRAAQGSDESRTRPEQAPAVEQVPAAEPATEPACENVEHLNRLDLQAIFEFLEAQEPLPCKLKESWVNDNFTTYQGRLHRIHTVGEGTTLLLC